MAVWENVRLCQERSKRFERGSLPWAYWSETSGVSFNLDWFQRKQIEDFSCCVGLSEERKMMLPAALEGSESAGDPDLLQTLISVCFWTV